MAAVEERVDALEARTRALETRLAELEAGGGPAPRASAAGFGTRPGATPAAGLAGRLRAATADHAGFLTAARPVGGASAALRATTPAEVESLTLTRATPVGACAPAPAGPSAPPRAVVARPDLATLEDVLGGRVLAWVGGVAMLVGVAFLLAIAVSRGWIGEEARTLLAAAVSLGLLGGGVRLFEHRGRTEAALAATAAGIAALFATITVATQVYALVPALLGMVGAVGVGATATVLAVRWRAQGIGALGIVGALAAPLLVGAPSATGTIALLFVAAASATGVLLWQRWNWLAFATFLLTAGQWGWWLVDAEPAAALVILVVGGFGILYTAGAAGFEVRMAAPRLRLSSTVLLALSAFTCAAAGWYALGEVAPRGLADGWLAVLAAAHLVAGAAGLRSRRVSHELGLVALGLGTILADVAFAQVVSGLPLVLGWAAGAVGFAWLVRGAAGQADVAFAGLGLGGHLALALGHALVTTARGGSEDTAVVLVGLGAVAVGCFASARLARDGHRAWRTGLDALGLAVVAYATAVALDGVALTLAWSGEAVALARLARRGAGGVDTAGGSGGPARRGADMPGGSGGPARRGADMPGGSGGPARRGADMPGGSGGSGGPARRGADMPGGSGGPARHDAGSAATDARGGADAVAIAGAGAFLLGALVVTLVELAPPGALILGLDPVLPALGGLAAVAGAAMLAANWLPSLHPLQRPVLVALAALVVLFGASAALVTPFQPGGESAGLPIAELGIRQQGQVLVSGLWALVGLTALVAGLVRDRRALRLSGLGLLATAVGKVFLFDLASLTSVYRVASFLALGLLLLCGAFAWQRIRPPALPDLRGVPEGLR